MQTVCILGASDKPERYSYKAKNLLQQYGHTTLLVHPKLTVIENQQVYSDLKQIAKKIDTLTIYINPKLSSSIFNDIIELKPKRVIFNPGTENPEIYNHLTDVGIKVEEACTLVLLNTNQFDLN